MSQIGHTFNVTGTNLFMFLFGNPAWNGSLIMLAQYIDALAADVAVRDTMLFIGKMSRMVSNEWLLSHVTT